MYLDGLDGLDQKIVQLLIENARISYSDIGEKIGISRVAVKARIQALEQKGIIEEYTTVINPQKISGAVSCYFEIETTPSCLSKVTEILKLHDTVTQIYRVTGQDKLHVHAVAASSEEMETFLHTVIDTLPGIVSCSCNMILSRIKDIKGLQLTIPGNVSMTVCRDVYKRQALHGVTGDLCEDDGHRSGDLCSCGGAGIPEDPEGTAGRSIKECRIKEERRKACDGILTEEGRAEADMQPPLFLLR